MNSYKNRLHEECLIDYNNIKDMKEGEDCL